MDELNKNLGFKPGAQHTPLKETLSLHYFVVSRKLTRTVAMMHQVQYAKMLVDRFLEETRIQKLKNYKTPMVEREIMKDGDDEPGFLRSTCQIHIGGVFYLARGTRPDLMLATSRLGRGVSFWRKVDDLAMVRLMGYLAHHLGLGIEIRVDSSEKDLMYVGCHTDSDLGDDDVTTKSTSGYVVGIMGPIFTRALSGWGAKLQQATAKSTPESEAMACCEAVCRSLFPTVTLWCDLLNREVVFEAALDADTARLVIQRGYSGKLRYLRKH